MVKYNSCAFSNRCYGDYSSCSAKTEPVELKEEVQQYICATHDPKYELANLYIKEKNGFIDMKMIF